MSPPLTQPPITTSTRPILNAVSAGFRDVVKLSDELAQLELIHGAESPRLERKQRALKEKNETNDTLQALFDEVKANWQDANGRRLGAVDWAPEISVRVDDCTYTRDIATFVVDKAKLENFTANIVDLGNQFTATQLEDRFWPNGVADVRQRD
ncbi:hypothetical protein NLJ89_g12359 [Agrocybe chaxingu]|uniref:Uncharacterized protein n=1 Tax=Agrocybe chaxingu TaxID=84603 RepID=A0A9W8MM82_9AGAR|nr:hypothetical protein NLJ89_g12359 [Agrocybe chaxingu]